MLLRTITIILAACLCAIALGLSGMTLVHYVDAQETLRAFDARLTAVTAAPEAGVFEVTLRFHNGGAVRTQVEQVTIQLHRGRRLVSSRDWFPADLELAIGHSHEATLLLQSNLEEARLQDLLGTDTPWEVRLFIRTVLPIQESHALLHRRSRLGEE